MKRDDDGDDFGVVVEVDDVVAVVLALDLLTNVPREVDGVAGLLLLELLLLSGATFLASKAGRNGFGAGVRPAKRFLSTTLSTVVLLAVTGSAVVVDRYRLTLILGGLVKRLPVPLLPLFVSFCCCC